MSKPYNKPCKICGSINQILFDDDEDRTSIFCKDCKNFEDIYVSEELQQHWDEQDRIKNMEQQQLLPKCPTCQSQNIKKISTTTKIMNTALWGIWGTKRHKTFHCNNCSYEW